jgi:hypothetical protein
MNQAADFIIIYGRNAGRSWITEDFPAFFTFLS